MYTHVFSRAFVRTLAIAVAVSILFSPLAPTLFAQTANPEAVRERRAELERQLERLESEIAEQQTLLNGKRQERVSIERDIAILDAQIRQAQLAIEAQNLIIRQLGLEIGDKEKTIVGLDDKLGREKMSLAQLLRKTNEIDEYSLAEVVLGSQDLSDFFADLDSFNTIKAELQGSFVVIEGTKADTQVEKQTLQEKQAQEVELRKIQQLQKAEIEVREKERQRILGITKGVESAYQTIVQSKQLSAAQIRAELFALRDSAAIPFEKALEYANFASKQTGVRPALILGVVAQESRLGEFIGTGNWRTDMHPTRDQPVFVEIMRELGLDPDLMPVSKKPSYGWGGAMGPAQFIPSTWILYKDRIASVSGQNPPNPYEPRTAFIASGLLMADNGADKGGYANERLAALRYFAGWTNASNPAYAFYGDGVLELAAKYQQQIDILSAS
ncbi:MAG TPA: hypothetical protein VGA06_01230 [Candidatus Paceibacterota bacterium]|jgi:hypothetical protein